MSNEAQSDPPADASTPLQHPHLVDEVRIDKWLWAARFFKTRSLAKQAIENGRVRYNGERCKVGRDVIRGAKLQIRQGWDEVTVEVLALSDRRCAAPEARLLYREDADSVMRREQAALQRRALNTPTSEARPSKKDRRSLIHIKRFKPD